MSYVHALPQREEHGLFGITHEDDVSVAETLSSVSRAVLPDYMLMANKLMKDMAQKRRIRNYDEFAANLFIPLYETITGRKVQGAIYHPDSEKDILKNLNLLLKQLSIDLQNTSLSHIRTEDLISGDRVATCNLLEILQGLTEYTLKKGYNSNLEMEDEDNLSTFRSQTSTIAPDVDSSGDKNTKAKNYNERVSPKHFEQPFNRTTKPHINGFFAFDGQRGPNPNVIESASCGSSVTLSIDSDNEDQNIPSNGRVVKDTKMYSKLRKQMRHAEKRAEQVGLIAQLLSNCALVDRLNVKNGRRALNELAFDELSEVTDSTVSVDEEGTYDNLSVDDDTADLEDEMPGMSLSNAALRRLQKYISPLLLNPPPIKQIDQVEKHRTAAERRVIAEANRRENVLSRMVRREIAAEKRLRELAERRTASIKAKIEDRNARLASAQAKRYEKQMVQNHTGLQANAAHQSELIMREALTEGSRIEHQHRLILEQQVREEQTKHTSNMKEKIESLESMFHDQFCELTESAKDEKESIEIEAKAKKLKNCHMKQELRLKLESDIRKFQESLRTDADDAAFFRRLDANRALQRRYKSDHKK